MTPIRANSSEQAVRHFDKHSSRHSIRIAGSTPGEQSPARGDRSGEHRMFA
jgi:hypothetical protein